MYFKGWPHSSPQEAIDAAKEQAHSRAVKRDRRRRQWRMEGSFGDAATHHGFKRARWRRLWRRQIQDWLIATVQNLRTLVRYAAAPTRAACGEVLDPMTSVVEGVVMTLGSLTVLFARSGVRLWSRPAPVPSR